MRNYKIVKISEKNYTVYEKNILERINLSLFNLKCEKPAWKIIGVKFKTLNEAVNFCKNQVNRDFWGNY